MSYDPNAGTAGPVLYPEPAGFQLPPLWGQGGILFPNGTPPDPKNPLAGSPVDPRSYFGGTDVGAAIANAISALLGPNWKANAFFSIVGVILVGVGIVALIWG